jgi:hypothetical protein
LGKNLIFSVFLGKSWIFPYFWEKVRFFRFFGKKLKFGENADFSEKFGKKFDFLGFLITIDVFLKKTLGLFSGLFDRKFRFFPIFWNKI